MRAGATIGASPDAPPEPQRDVGRVIGVMLSACRSRRRGASVRLDAAVAAMLGDARKRQQGGDVQKK